MGKNKKLVCSILILTVLIYYVLGIFINNRLSLLFALGSLVNIGLLILFLKMFFLFEKNIEFYEKRDLL